MSELLVTLRRMADVPSDEGLPFSELDHGLQCAYELSLRHPDDRELQLAGLVHDVGHQFGDDASHATVGAAYVRPFLGHRVAELVALHVPAKRYLTAVDPAHGLTSVSVTSLAAQGGPMSPAEIDAFLALPYAADAIELRRADDAAKLPGRPVPSLDHWGL